MRLKDIPEERLNYKAGNKTRRKATKCLTYHQKIFCHNRFPAIAAGK
jgi:hypothetical protein